MTTTTRTLDTAAGPARDYTPRIPIAIGLMNSINLAVLLLAAGTWRWPNAWALVLVTITCQTTAVLVLRKKNPTLLNERAKFVKPGTKPFDKILLSSYLAMGVATFVVAGLDARFAWTHVPLPLTLAGYALIGAGFSFAVWAMLTNTHFETTVRIQDDRAHKVCTEGPYRIVRHPGYAGSLLALLGVPLALGALTAYLPAAVYTVLIVTRTALEDRTLHRELEGYPQFAQQTRHRLLPGLW